MQMTDISLKSRAGVTSVLVFEWAASGGLQICSGKDRQGWWKEICIWIVWETVHIFLEMGLHIPAPTKIGTRGGWEAPEVSSNPGVGTGQPVVDHCGLGPRGGNSQKKVPSFALLLLHYVLFYIVVQLCLGPSSRAAQASQPVDSTNF